ncbi:hypothetical protein R3P38DRAFT_1508710 [Favolaschia claudopus]|uniref:Uncharacterized protein n=1 Tax=Favolaschia claudopus TaxID=2862362 RepID=A0AAW0AKB8_9AGAR
MPQHGITPVNKRELVDAIVRVLCREVSIHPLEKRKARSGRSPSEQYTLLASPAPQIHPDGNAAHPQTARTKSPSRLTLRATGTLICKSSFYAPKRESRLGVVAAVRHFSSPPSGHLLNASTSSAHASGGPASAPSLERRHARPSNRTRLYPAVVDGLPAWARKAFLGSPIATISGPRPTRHPGATSLHSRSYEIETILASMDSKSKQDAKFCIDSPPTRRTLPISDGTNQHYRLHTPYTTSPATSSSSSSTSPLRR